MIYCILSIILLVIIYDVLAINKIHKRSSLHDPRKKDFVQDIKEYDMNDAASIFNDYNLKYSIRYQNDAEKAKVFNVFRDNLRKINYLNQMTKTAAFSINEFTSMSLEEFTTKYTGYNSANAKVDSYMTRFEYDPKFVYSKNRDFREGGLLIVKHQKECSNSYVHCAVGNIEAQYDRKYKLHTVLSEQHAFDCEPMGSCAKGGVPHHVFEHLSTEGGLMQLMHYPANSYASKGRCATDTDKIFVRFRKYARFDIGNEQILSAALDTIGPLCTTMFVSESVKNYKSGILDPKDCHQSPTNHAVLLMGYGIEDDTPYWIVKNSWGFDWGEAGYLRLVRGKSACNIGAEYVASVLLDDNVNPEVDNDNQKDKNIPRTKTSERSSEAEHLRQKHVDQQHKPFNCSKDIRRREDQGCEASDKPASESETETDTETITTTTTAIPELVLMTAGYQETIDWS